jgi:hypothetical protein
MSKHNLPYSITSSSTDSGLKGSHTRAPEVDHILSWVKKLLRAEPSERPTAQEALEDLREIIKSLSDDVLRTPPSEASPKQFWTYKEMLRAITLLLRGHGDEAILFAELRGTKPPRDRLNFSDGSFEDRLELIGRVFRFLSNMGLTGGTLNWITPNSKSKK